MDEEKIIGPLTFRQFIYTAIGVGAVYLVHNNFKQEVSIPFSIVAIALTMFSIWKAQPAPFTEETIRNKRSTLSKEDFDKWCRRKIAMLESQIYYRKMRGLPPDPSLEKVKDSILKFMNDGKV